jgi:hypothetical protein
MPLTGAHKFEQLFRKSAGLDVGKVDIARYQDFINRSFTTCCSWPRRRRRRTTISRSSRMGAVSEPFEFAICLFDGEVVNAGEPPLHQTCSVIFPVLVAERAEPASAVIMPFRA